MGIRKQKNEISQERIINAAIEEFGKYEFAVASTNAICKNNEISKGLLFHYFKSKDELFLRCVEVCFSELVAHITENYQRSGDTVEEMLNHYIEVRFTFFEKYPSFEQLFKSATFNAPPHLVADIYQLRKPLRQINEAILMDMLNQLHVKETIDKFEVVTIILEFVDYSQIKQRFRQDDSEKRQVDVSFKEEIQQLVNLINMLFYGILQ